MDSPMEPPVRSRSTRRMKRPGVPPMPVLHLPPPPIDPARLSPGIPSPTHAASMYQRPPSSASTVPSVLSPTTAASTSADFLRSPVASTFQPRSRDRSFNAGGFFGRGSFSNETPSPSSPSLAVSGRSPSSRSVKEKASGLLSRFFTAVKRDKSRERSRKDRDNDSNNESESDSSVVAVRFGSVRAPESRSGRSNSRRLVPPSSNDFATMFPSLARSNNDRSEAIEPGMLEPSSIPVNQELKPPPTALYYPVTVHSFTATKHLKISDTDSGGKIRMEVYNAFQVPARQASSIYFSIYNSKHFGNANADLSDQDLYDICRLTHIPDLIVIPTESSIRTKTSKLSALHENEELVAAELFDNRCLTSISKGRPALHITTDTVEPHRTVVEHQVDPAHLQEPVRRVIVETPTSASPNTLQSLLASVNLLEHDTGIPKLKSRSTSSSVDTESSAQVSLEDKRHTLLSRVVSKIARKDTATSGSPLRKKKQQKAAAARALLPLPDNAVASPPNVTPSHSLRHHTAYDDLKAGSLFFGERPSAPTIVENIEAFFPSLVVDDNAIKDSVTDRSQSTVKSNSVLLTKETIKLLRENSERNSIQSAFSSMGRSRAESMGPSHTVRLTFEGESKSVPVDHGFLNREDLPPGPIGSAIGSPTPLSSSVFDESDGKLNLATLNRGSSLWRRRADNETVKRNVTEVWKQKVAELGQSGGLFVSVDPTVVGEEDPTTPASSTTSPGNEGTLAPRSSFESDISHASTHLEGDKDIHDDLLPPLISKRTKRRTWKGFVPQRGPPPDDEQLVPFSEDNTVSVELASPVEDVKMSVSVVSSSQLLPAAAEEASIVSSAFEELKAASSAEQNHINFWKGKMIGQGSFGAVYFGVNLTTKELIAVKQVQLVPIKKRGKTAGPMSNRAEKMVEALSVEISLLKELSHENVVRYLGFDVVENVVSVFLEYVDGGSLASILSRFGKFEYSLAQSFTHQILCGLEYLHDRCIVHRDIKGANILVNRHGVVKIADFGISKKNEYKYQANSRMSVQGTVYWMAPEVMTNKGGYSAKIDIWSLGCVVYEMLVGHHPWRELNEMQIMWKVGMEHAAPPLPDYFCEEVRTFLGSCFVVEPDKRPTATELFSYGFAAVDPWCFDFEEWLNRVEAQKMLEDEQAGSPGVCDSNSDSDSSGDESS